jgi:hypothetical protein
VKGKRPSAELREAENLAAKPLSTPDGVNVFNQSFDATRASLRDLAAKAGTITGDRTSEPAASNDAAKAAFLRPKYLFADIVCPNDSLFHIFYTPGSPDSKGALPKIRQ